VYTSVVLSGLSIYALAFIGYTAVLGALNPEPEVLEPVEKPKTKPKQTKAKNNGI
jgi:hypothetical protein